MARAGRAAMHALRACVPVSMTPVRRRKRSSRPAQAERSSTPIASSDSSSKASRPETGVPRRLAPLFPKDPAPQRASQAQCRHGCLPSSSNPSPFLLPYSALLRARLPRAVRLPPPPRRCLPIISAISGFENPSTCRITTASPCRAGRADSAASSVSDPCLPVMTSATLAMSAVGPAIESSAACAPGPPPSEACP